MLAFGFILQGQPTVDHVRIENPRELQESMNMPRPGSAGADTGSRVERPRLNLKPRSLPVEKIDETTERERSEILVLYMYISSNIILY